jgi:hypothetical protein
MMIGNTDGFGINLIFCSCGYLTGIELLVNVIVEFL